MYWLLWELVSFFLLSILLPNWKAFLKDWASQELVCFRSVNPELGSISSSMNWFLTVSSLDKDFLDFDRIMLLLLLSVEERQLGLESPSMFVTGADTLLVQAEAILIRLSVWFWVPATGVERRCSFS